ncbi:MAG: hypothetical protein EBV21_07975, partial [Betaproteobacteria bacterium]|nr:hypothetical protein [Betaproteobacteria bacterium]
MSGPRSGRHWPSIYSWAMKRRLVSIPALTLAAILLLITAPLWIVISAVVDLVRGRRRLPTTRLLAFAFSWSWLELSGVTMSLVLWMTGR